MTPWPAPRHTTTAMLHRLHLEAEGWPDGEELPVSQEPEMPEDDTRTESKNT